MTESVLFVDDGQVLTSAGSAAALDLALHVVRSDYGAVVATSVARRLVFSSHRSGGQQQFIHRPVPEAGEGPLARVMMWVEDRVAGPVAVRDMAAAGGVSVATLHRAFRAELGTTPLAWLTARRLERARELLEATDLTIEAVARNSGFSSAANLRERFRVATGLTPTEHRSRFTRR